MSKNVYVTIKVKEGTVLPASGGHILVYDHDADAYYSVSLADVFKNEREICEQVQTKESEFEDAINAKIKEMDEKYNSFLATYKESNAKMIELIESVVGEGDKE
jgi:hypothetical protein